VSWASKQDVWYPEGFTGRWLVVSAGGDCLMDYANGACDAERELPLTSLCSLAVAMTQFLDAAGGEETEAVKTHSMEFNSFLLATCAGPSFSVLAVVGLPEERPSELSTAEFRFKAAEIHAALRGGVIWDELQRLVGASGQDREEKATNYTLSSCLGSAADGDGLDTALPPHAASAAREVFATALRARCSTPVQAALNDLSALCAADRQQDLKLCLFDTRLEILTVLPSLDEAKPWQAMGLLRSAGEEVCLSKEASTSVWAWQSESGKEAPEVAVLCPQARPLLVGAVLTSRCGLPAVPKASGSCAVCRLTTPPGEQLSAIKSSLEKVAMHFCEVLGLSPPAKPLGELVE